MELNGKFGITWNSSTGSDSEYVSSNRLSFLSITQSIDIYNVV